MMGLRNFIASTTDLACDVFGREKVVRAARFVLRRACLDSTNEMRSNGECWLQHHILSISSNGEPVHVLDVGANIGQWSKAMLEAAEEEDRLADLDLHAFEPASYTFAGLEKSLDQYQVTLVRVALSDKAGVSKLFIAGPGAGTNSLHPSEGTRPNGPAEEIVTTTLDQYVERKRIECVTLVKIDAEGHDLTAMRGAHRLLEQGRIRVMQFEYNSRWIYSRSFLRDAFELLNPLDYHIGKLTARGVEFYNRWHPDLETFVEGNYISCRKEVMAELPSIDWWKRET